MTASRSVAVCLLLSGCTGVPALYAPPTPANGVSQQQETLLAPKVRDIVDEVACELARSKAAGALQEPYTITILLTLQVEDNLDLAPSLTFIHPLAAASTNRSVLLNGDLAGNRKRNFTTNYYLDSDRLSLASCQPNAGRPKLYQLSGELGLADVVRDGEGSFALETSTAHVVRDSGDKAIPTFGSTVVFTVTKQLGGLGPIWTIKHFKGPSGSNGLFTGKSIRTDTLTIAFAKQPAVRSAKVEVAQAVAQEAAERRRRADALVADLRLKEVQANAVYEERLRTRGEQHGATEKRTFQFQVDRAQIAATQSAAALASAQADAARARSDEETANRQLAETIATTSAESQAAATDAGQNLLTTMVLQNLSIQPH
jgi:hypothetical protein